MIRETPFGAGPKGEPLHLFTLSNGRGVEVAITNFGGIVTSVMAPDRRGRAADVVLGFNSIGPYLAGHPYFGAIIGRIAGRLTPADFTLNGERHTLAANQFPHHLHGGQAGFDRRVWNAHVVTGGHGDELVLTYRSPAGEEGYPGNVDVTVRYGLTEANALTIGYQATSDRATPLSLTNHSYFNLKGESGGPVTSHQFQVLADEFTPVAPNFAHTGFRQPVVGQANDLRSPALLSARLDALFGRHGDNYLLREPRGSAAVARVFEPDSGRVLDVFTTECCLQLYTGVNLDGTVVGKVGQPYRQFHGFCLECQGYPAAPHFPAFAPITLSPGEIYSQKTMYRFGVADTREFPRLDEGT